MSDPAPDEVHLGRRLDAAAAHFHLDERAANTCGEHSALCVLNSAAAVGA